MNGAQIFPPDEPEPLEDVLERLRPRLKAILRGFRIPAQDAEDVLQEALLVASQKWSLVRQQESWLIGTLRFKCALYWKRQRAARVTTHDVSVLEGLSAPQPPAQEQTDRLLDLDTVTRELGGQARAMLWLRYAYGLSHGEVAARLGAGAANVRKTTGRSLARLQKRFA